MNKSNFRILVILLLATLCGSVASAENGAVTTTEAGVLFASVGDGQITGAEYNRAVQQARRSKFYHGTPPEGEVEKLRNEVAREVIIRKLLLQEAQRIGLSADEGAIRESIAGFDKRYADSPRWAQQRDTLVKELERHFREEDVIRQLEARTRTVSPPTRTQVDRYYRNNLDKFTEPAQHRLSVILLRVAPSSSNDTWGAAMEEGSRLVSSLENGAEFAELAKMHSSDASSGKGGDMGYLHAGMLSPSAESVIAELKAGDVSQPIRLLEGIAIFRLEDRKASRLRELSEVSGRARELWLREQGENAWARLKEELWKKTPISIHDTSIDLAVL